MSFLCCASDGIRILGRCRYLRMNSVLSSVMILRGSPGFLPRAEKVTFLSVTSMIRLLETATLCVYLPRYSTALPNPLKVSLI